MTETLELEANVTFERTLGANTPIIVASTPPVEVEREIERFVPQKVMAKEVTRVIEGGKPVIREREYERFTQKKTKVKVREIPAHNQCMKLKVTSTKDPAVRFVSVGVEASVLVEKAGTYRIEISCDKPEFQATASIG